MTIEERVELYKSLFPDCKAIKAVKQVIIAKGYRNAPQPDKIELIRELDTALADEYQITIPVVTFFVRDNNYVKATKEIFLTDPADLEGFLHQFRHHLQNEAREQDKRLLLVENKKIDHRIPYRDTIYTMEGEDDARAWSRFIMEEA